MKLSIGINIFNQNERQNIAVECLKRLKQKNSNIEVYNISYKDELQEVSEFKSLPILGESSSTLTGNEMVKKPIANEFFNILSNTECDYFLFLNSDIILSQKALNLIFAGNMESYIFSRHEIKPITSLEDKIIPYKIEVAGFDAWAVKKAWWIENGNTIPKCIYSEVAWDNIMSLSLFTKSNAKFCNKEFYIGHLSHPINWSRETPEGMYNMKTWNSMAIAPKWDYYMQAFLFRRSPRGQYLNPIDNEETMEKSILTI